MAKRRTQNSSGGGGGGGGGMLLAVVVLLIAAALVGCWVYKAQNPAGTDQASTQSGAVGAPASAELVTDDRIIYGGIPRPRAGAPASVASLEVFKNRAYMVGYSEERKDPLWSAYRVFHNPNPYNLPRPTGGFLTDERSAAHVKDADFRRSGYDRGHMTPNSAIMHDYGADAQLETFLLTNICPQSPALNEKVWEKLETDERRYADRFEEVWVVDGPIFSDLNGGITYRLASGISVPTAFYKILLDETGGPGGKPRVFSVIMPQTVKGTELPQQFLTSVREIEKETDLEFLWKLDSATQAQLEDKAWPMWDISP